MVLIFFTFLYFGKEINNLDIDVRTHSLDLRDVFENLEKNQNKIAIEYKLNFNFIVLLENQVETCIDVSEYKSVLSRIFELFEYSNSFSRILLFIFVFVPL